MKCQLILAGIGGQGVLFASRIFTTMARRSQQSVLGSQTFGMAQRGGSVMTHLKIGAFDSPLVCEGDANLLFALDCVEAHRALHFLQPATNGKSALCVVNAAPAQGFPDQRVSQLLHDMGVRVHVCDADAVALEMGSPQAANLVLLGFGSSQEGFPFNYDQAREATDAVSSPAHRAVNQEALRRGWARGPTLRQENP